ncbi:MAG TPA: energy transducer TonB [Flavisolibacter sp.]|nr:energy transducer TonB [Flavisolibacter sp.]
MSSQKTYTAKDVERYHRGGMSAAEMHLLENAALDDPALADMLEGYALASTPSADLQKLHKRLQQRIKEEKKGGGVIFGQPWLRIAALFVLIAGGVWLVVQTLSSNSNSLAKNDESDSATILTNKTLRQPDSGPAVVQVAPSPLSADSPERINDAVAVETKTPKAAKAGRNKPAAAPLKPNDNVTASNETGSAASSISLMKADEKSKDSTTVAGTVAGRSPAPAARSMNDTIRDINIVLKRNNLPVDEVVISKTKQQASRRQAAVVIDTLEPEQGWSTFDDYIAENLHAPEELKTKSSSTGIVELSFRVDKEGNPTNITVTQSLCEKCDAEAIRLLKEGPKWKGKKGKVKIRFPQSP